MGALNVLKPLIRVLALLLPLPASAQITLSVDSNRQSGMAPLAIIFSADPTTHDNRGASAHEQRVCSRAIA
jgi:hypothetical protein